jgi:hypothetical protein
MAYRNSRMMVDSDDKFGDVQTKQTVSLRLMNGDLLVVGAEGEFLEVRNKSNQMYLSLSIGENGTELKLSCPTIHLSTENMIIDAKNIDFRATDQLNLDSGGDLNLTCGGNMNNRIAGAFKQRAEEIQIVSDLGDLELKANDNIKLNGEQVLLNCD